MMLRHVSTLVFTAGAISLAGCKLEAEVEGDLDDIDLCDNCPDPEEECPTDFTCPDAADDYWVDFNAINGSGVSGVAWLNLNEFQQLDVWISAEGLEPNVTVPQHIHGFEDATINAVCPPATADLDADGLVSLQEGLPFYGPVLLPLEPFPVSDASGEVLFDITFDAIDTCPLLNRVIVLHAPDGLPVACGQIRFATDADLNAQ